MANESNIQEKFKSLGSMLLAVSILCLALAIVYFTFEAQSWRKDLPGILKLTGETAGKLQPSIAGVADAAKLIPAIVEEISKAREVIRELVIEVGATRQALPGILKEVEPITRQVADTTISLPKAVGPVLDEVRKTREQIPGILKEIRETHITIQKALIEVRQTRGEIPAIIKNVEAIHRDMPTWLETIDRAAEAVQKISEETGQVKILVPDILAEMKKTREELPALMAQADRIVMNAQKMGREAGAGAFTGFVGGIVTAPFGLVQMSADSVASVFKPLGEELTETDVVMINERLLRLIEAMQVGSSVDWHNPESGNKGILTLEKIYDEKGRKCLQVRHDISINGKKKKRVTQKACEQPDGTWTDK